MCCSPRHRLPILETRPLLGVWRALWEAVSPILPTDRFRGTNSKCNTIYRLIFTPWARVWGLQALVLKWCFSSMTYHLPIGYPLYLCSPSGPLSNYPLVSLRQNESAALAQQAVKLSPHIISFTWLLPDNDNRLHWTDHERPIPLRELIPLASGPTKTWVVITAQKHWGNFISHEPKSMGKICH